MGWEVFMLLQLSENVESDTAKLMYKWRSRYLFLIWSQKFKTCTCLMRINLPKSGAELLLKHHVYKIHLRQCAIWLLWQMCQECEVRHIYNAAAMIYSRLQNKLPSFWVLCYVSCKPNCWWPLAWCVLATWNQIVHILQQLRLTCTRITTQKDVNLCPEHNAEHIL